MKAAISAVVVVLGALLPTPAKGLVDLSVTAVSGPSVATQGDTISVTAMVAASAGTYVTIRTGISFYISTDATISTSDTLIGSVPIAMPPGQSGDVTNPYCVIPTTVAAGEYFIGAIINPQGAADENPANNALAGGAIVIEPPSGDLGLSFVGGPSVGDSGRTINLTATATLSSGATRSLTPRVGFYLSVDPTITTGDLLLYYVDVPLSPGESASVAPAMQVPGTLPTGTYFSGAIVDYLGRLGETDESNNSLSGNAIAITFHPPDLRPTSLSGPPLLVAGAQASLSARIESSPEGSSTVNVEVSFYLSTDTEISTGDTRVGRITIRSLPPGGSRVTGLTVTIPATTPSGTYYWGVIVGSLNDASPSNDRLTGGVVTISPEECTPGVPAALEDWIPCTSAYCDPVLGLVRVPAAPGTSCSDGNACNGSETCSTAGDCVAGPAPAIDDGNPCTMDSCDTVVGVQNVPIPPGAICPDGNTCNGQETCDGAGGCIPGVPLGLDDGDPCTVDACTPGLGLSHTPVYGCGVSACTPSLGAIYSYDPTGNLTEVISTATDPRHCGCAGNACPSSSEGEAACEAGVCGVSMGGAYINTSSDVSNCGRVGHACSSPANGVAVCFNGVCHASCGASYVNSAEQCIDLLDDPWNCGFVGNACAGVDAGSAFCESGWCGSTSDPVVYAVNGISTGEVFMVPKWAGITVTGAGLGGVTRILFEDWGDATSTREVDGARLLPLPRRLWDRDWDDRLLFSAAATTLTIHWAAITQGGNSLVAGVWYRPRLFYGRIDPVDGSQSSMLLDVAVSFAWADPAGSPSILAVNAIQELPTPYDPYPYNPNTGFIRIENDWPLVPGQWSDPGPAPIAILGNDLLATEFPILSISSRGVYVRAGLPTDDYGHVSPVLQRRAWAEMASAVFIFPYDNSPNARIHLGDESDESGINWNYRGGVLLRGAGLYDEGEAVDFSDWSDHSARQPREA